MGSDKKVKLCQLRGPGQIETISGRGRNRVSFLIYKRASSTKLEKGLKRFITTLQHQYGIKKQKKICCFLLWSHLCTIKSYTPTCCLCFCREVCSAGHTMSNYYRHLAVTMPFRYHNVYDGPFQSLMCDQGPFGHPCGNHKTIIVFLIYLHR